MSSVNLSRSLIQRAFKLVFPKGWIWKDKTNGGDLEKKIDGFSGQFARDGDQLSSLAEAMSPDYTDFLPEWDEEFFQAPGDLTEEERRSRFSSRINLFFNTESRLETMEDIFHNSGFPGLVIRTLGWYGVNESPYDFFPDTGFGFYGADEAIYGATDMIYNNTQVVGNAILVTNGGSIEYALSGPNAIVQLQQDSDFWGAYFVIEGAAGATYEIDERLKETFFDILYILKPVRLHGILNVKFV
jgi:hypothetical protein